MSSFIHDDFLLETQVAKDLYHQVAKDLPIIDYHNHLSAKDIADHHTFKDLTEIWLEGDHYKWRAMRAMGVSEDFITGKASHKEKFLAWAKTVPSTLRNPLYHWSHLELKRYFDIDELLNEGSAEKIYEEANRQLATDTHNAVSLLSSMKVEVLCTTDDPLDELEDHRRIQEDVSIPFKVLPTWRPDRLLAFQHPRHFSDTKERLEALTQESITDISSYLSAIKKRHDFFHEMGCRLSDHGLNQMNANTYEVAQVEASFKRLLNGGVLLDQDVADLQSHLLHEMAKMDYDRSWVQQFHLGALRDANAGGLEKLGKDTGFDSIGDFSQAEGLARFLSVLEHENCLAKTIIYNVNPTQNAVFAIMAGTFNDGSMMGKVQWGAAWWFLDQKDGMEEHLNVLSNLGLLRPFVGMLTDSRSLLSFPRHEYFRRILCNVLGNDVEKGLIPKDMDLLGEYVYAICYGNAKAYFPFTYLK